MITYNPQTDTINRTPKQFDKDSEEYKIIQLIKGDEQELASILMLSLDISRLDIIKYLLFDYYSPRRVLFKYEDKYNDKIIPLTLTKERELMMITFGDWVMMFGPGHYRIEIKNKFSQYQADNVGVNFDKMYETFLKIMSNKVK